MNRRQFIKAAVAAGCTVAAANLALDEALVIADKIQWPDGWTQVIVPIPDENKVFSCYLKGKISEVRFWDRRLSDGELIKMTTGDDGIDIWGAQIEST